MKWRHRDSFLMRLGHGALRTPLSARILAANESRAGGRLCCADLTDLARPHELLSGYDRDFAPFGARTLPDIQLTATGELAGAHAHHELNPLPGMGVVGGRSGD